MILFMRRKKHKNNNKNNNATIMVHAYYGEHEKKGEDKSIKHQRESKALRHRTQAQD